MPLPVAHTLLGSAIYVAADRDADVAGWRRWALAVGLANAADVDYLPGMLLGDPHRFHRMATHSLGWSASIGLVVALCVALGWVRGWPLRRHAGAVATGVFVALLWSSHLVLDLLNQDYSEPVGLMLLWPLSSVWTPGLPIFASVDKVAGAATPLEFGRSLLSLHNVGAAFLEALLTGPILLAAIGWRRRRSR